MKTIKISKDFYLPINLIEYMWDYTNPSASIKKFLHNAKETDEKNIIDLTRKRALKSIVSTTSGKLILSPISIDTLSQRMLNEDNNINDEKDS